MGLIIKPNHFHIKVLFLNSVNNSVSETQPLFHGPLGLMDDEFEICMGRDAVLQQQLVTVSSGLFPPVTQLV